MWTIGHGARSLDDFRGLLAQHQIEVEVDVRRWPVSKTAHFRRAAMERWLSEAGIRYMWLGETLGGYRSGGYPRYMQTEQFQAGLHRLLTLAHQGRTCVMCLEISPAGCHRRFIAERLNAYGVKTLHIISASKVRYRVGLQ